jgi:hypothetical protein
MFVPHRKHTYGSRRADKGRALLLCVDYVRTSQGTQLWAPAACYGDSFTFLYVDVRTSQETHQWASSVCYGDSFIFYKQMMLVPDRKHNLGLPQPDAERALLPYM